MKSNRFRTCLITNTVLATVAMLFITVVAHSDELRFQAVWHSGTGTNIFTAPESHDDFLEGGTELVNQGLRLIDVETARIDERRVYSGIWVNGIGSNIIVGPIGPMKLRQERNQRAAQGLRLVDIEIFRSPSGGGR